jgi:ribA/ribD-fused uncharacterized protein
MLEGDTMKYSTEILNEYVEHNENHIKGFIGEYCYLSNFQLCNVEFEGKMYPSAEHAYMASKSIYVDVRKKFSLRGNLSCGQAKRLGQTIELRPNWNMIKYNMMFVILYDKFTRTHDLRQLLAITDNIYLEETNHWNDMYWGVDYKTGNGSNHLGNILMKIREMI